ncbi:MAG: TonB-dependent receptor [Paludibacter sp.]|nr:TonB-dependent receptor [Paludibacter sp.]
MKNIDERNESKQPKRKAWTAMLLMLFFCMLSINLMAQNLTVSGSVKSTLGEPVPGASIVVKGTNRGTMTDANGNYSLGKVSSDAVLVFSFVGMKKQEIKVDGKTKINLVLEDDAIGLDEVVAVGYGTSRRKDLTGSVASVSGATLRDIPVTSAAEAIVGRMPGVQVTRTEGSPDADIKIRVRGGGSLTQDNSPLYIVDGFPVDNINDIAPTDITSIDVLKDASSTAIYGARGANGVILITTKGGFDGKGKVSYNTYYGVKKITKMLDVLNPYEYVYWQYELQNATNPNLESYYGDFQDYSLYKKMKGTNWQDEVFGQTGTSQYNNIAVTGGSKTSKYNISLTRNDEKEIMIGSGYTRTNLTIKTYHKINDWLNLDLNTRLSDNNLKGGGTTSNSRLSHALQYRPVNGLSEFIDYSLTSNDYETTSAYILNPVDQTNDDYRRTKNLLFNFNGAATIKLSNNLNYRLEYGTQYGENTLKRFYGIHTSNALSYGEQPLASIEKTNTKNYRLANILNYTKKDFLPGNNLTVMVGEELNCAKSDVITTSAKYFPKYIDVLSALSMMQLGIADPIVTADNPANKVSSFFGRLNYDYKGRYLASATFRADGSSKFAPGNQWGYFPSAALAWRISDEPFMLMTKQWLSDLKLRVSYGESGNNRISDNAWKKTFSVLSSGLYIDGNETTPTPYILPNTVLSNPDLKWETTITRNIGLDYSLFKQRLSGSIEIYKNTTTDLLISATIPSSSGYSRQWQNIGQTSNKGLEFVLNGIIYENKDFKLSTSFNIGFNRNRIDKLGDTKQWEQSSINDSNGPTGDYLIKEGGQIGQMYGYETEGMYSFDDFNYSNGVYTLKQGVSDNSALIQARRFAPGALKLKDQNGDFVVNTADKKVIGNANPKHTGGFNLMAQYKGFDLSAFFNWVYGNDIYNMNKLYFSSFSTSRYYKNILDIMNSDNRFTYIDKETGAVVSDPTLLAEMNKNATMWSPAHSLVPLHSWAIEDGSFLRLNTLTIGYSLPKSLLNKLKLEKLRLYATAYNVWTWTNYSGYDPEVDTQRSTPLTPGVDWNAYPRSRTFNIGLNVEF